ncbi:hypothetical protein FOMA001_g9767 [Fusarium oxysporum f. sp. matthiolae]|nr:hypothetical protein FOMA001_g9767 [Fusarium oxysporum f. sp. matthiolae]
MTTANTTAQMKQALEAISIPAPSAPRGTPRIIPILRPPSGGALPVRTQLQTAQLKYHLETQRIDQDVQKTSHMRIIELIKNHDIQISALKNELYALKDHLPTLTGQQRLRNICRILPDIEQVLKDIRNQVAEADKYLSLRNRENDIQNNISQFVSTMKNQTPINRWRSEPENSDTSSSEWASSDDEQEQEDPEVAESSDQHSSSAPTFGSGDMGEGEASPSECSETVPSELCTSEKTPTPLSDSERSLALKLLMFLSTIDHASSPSHTNPSQPYEEAAKYQLPQLIERYFERLGERFKLSPRRPIACGIAQYRRAYEILGKALQPSQGRQLEPLHLNMEDDDRSRVKEMTEREGVHSAIGHGKFLAKLGRYYDLAMDESPYIEISVKLARLLNHLNALGKGIATQTVCPIPENLQAIRRQLQQLPKMPRFKKHEFRKPIAELSTLFENIEMSNDTYNLSIHDLRLHLYHCLSFKPPGMSSGFGLLDEVDDEHPLPDSTSGSSRSTHVLKLLEDQHQTYYKELDLMVTRSLQILKSWLRENNATNLQELSTHIGKAQTLQGGKHQNVLHMISIVCHQQLLKWAEQNSNYHKRKLEEAVEQGYEFALQPGSGNSETGDPYVMV